MAKSGCHSVIQYTYSRISILACFKTLLPKANKIYVQITLAIAVVNALSTIKRFQKYAFSMPPKTLRFDCCPHSSFDTFSIVHTIKGLVHTNAFSFENAYISMRFGLPSTLIS